MSPAAPRSRLPALPWRHPDGAAGLPTLWLLIAVLSFLIPFGQGTAALPELSQGEEAFAELRESGSGSSDEGPSDGEREGYHPSPGDGNPAAQATIPTLHPSSHARKGGHLPASPARPSEADDRSTAGPPPLLLGAPEGHAPPLPYFADYPVFLLGDLPPPTA